MTPGHDLQGALVTSSVTWKGNAMPGLIHLYSKDKKMPISQGTCEDQRS